MRASCGTVFPRLGFRSAIGAVLALTALSTPASAQRRSGTLIGWIRDSTGAPLANAAVAILSQRVLARTDSSGQFAIRNIDPGRVTVNVRRLGYEPISFDIDVHAGVPDSVSVKLSANAYVLEAMRADAAMARKYVELEEFYQRRAKGTGGVFFTREDIAARNSSRLSDIVREVPGIRYVRLEGGEMGIRFTSSANQRRDCKPQFWVDGQRVLNAEMDDFPPGDVEGLELYRGPSTTPMKFSQGAITSCGTVVIWSRIPGPP